jgi:hypothetical protein
MGWASADGKLIASAARTTVKIWDFEKGEQKQTVNNVANSKSRASSSSARRTSSRSAAGCPGEVLQRDNGGQSAV